MELPEWRLSCNFIRTNGGLDLTKENRGTPYAVSGSSSPMRARTVTRVPGDTWHWVLLCIGDVTVFFVAIAVARCKSKSQCYLPREYHRR